MRPRSETSVEVASSGNPRSHFDVGQVFALAEAEKEDARAEIVHANETFECRNQSDRQSEQDWFRT
jgi:hypothetical protein